MTFKMSKEAQTIKIYNLRADTSEFIGGGDAYIPAHTGLPAYCTDIEPPEAPAGHVAVFDDNEQKWDVVEDHRGKTVYDIQTGQAISIESLGSLPDNVVSVAPDGSYEKWDGKKWVKDEEAEKNARLIEATGKQHQLITDARIFIGEWQTALMLGSLSDENKVKLQSWIDYIEALKNVDLSDPDWPKQPA
ncbi:tail fiber assembly protein [Citrobacter koseri]|uniref:tail fiber assembly protein n=1 Tax=Citrobacter koseri TaxID=545 RepID=UPI0029424109|nr:tail fiber assembly protein [Citrobacter koseri]WOJ29325.1 tail fiber assembly protein [Citrobacter koseri]WOJ33499.1 tail fiber assembly protein [Citrobacter koseri]